MARSEDVVRPAVPGGIGKPLILALLALLASGALFGRGSKEGSATKGSQAAPDEGAGGLLGGLGGLCAWINCSAWSEPCGKRSSTLSADFAARKLG